MVAKYKTSHYLAKYYCMLLTRCIIIHFNNNYFTLLIGKFDEDEEISDDEMPDNPNDQI